MAIRLEQALKRISDSGLVLLAGGFMELHRHQHWHFLTLWCFGSVLGVHTLHFMSIMRGHETLGVWLSLGRLLPMGEVSEILPREVEAIVLERADDYLPWIQAGQINLGGGPTTDMQEFAEFDTAQSAAPWRLSTG